MTLKNLCTAFLSAALLALFGGLAQADEFNLPSGQTSLEFVPVGAPVFDFKSVLFGPPPTLQMWRTSVDPASGTVSYNGLDMAQPNIPFTWNWGDGTIVDGWFPQNHTYSDPSHNYVVTLTSHYLDGSSDSVSSTVRFVAPQINPVSLPSNVTVTIPAQPVTLSTRLYTPPSSLTYFTDSQLGIMPRATMGYVLTAAASKMMGFVGNNVYTKNGVFSQVVLRDPYFSGMYSIWYTDPIAFGVGGSMLEMDNYSFYMHEMGHNFTLNFPAAYYYGGRIDGNANAIYSETMAQIFQHATAYELVNHSADYGFGADLVSDLKSSALGSMKVVRYGYDQYLASGCQFNSWNNPATSGDETFGTFMTIAYKFFQHAENDNQGYEIPLKRMMEVLGLFDSEMSQQYDRQHNTPAANAFRSTLFVAALSHAFDADLRQEFRDLNFPVNDSTYQQLMTAVPEPGTLVLLVSAAASVLAYAWRRRKQAT